MPALFLLVLKAVMLSLDLLHRSLLTMKKLTHLMMRLTQSLIDPRDHCGLCECWEASQLLTWTPFLAYVLYCRAETF